MTHEDYRRALEAATREYEELGAKRQAIDKRLGELAQTIGTLSRLLGLTPTVPLGLTDAVRLVIRGAGVPMTPIEVRDRLQAIGFDVSKYSNDLAAVHTILKRLNGSGELRFVARGPGAHQYTWNWPATPVALGPDILRFMRESAAEREAMHATEEAAADAVGAQAEESVMDLAQRRRFFAEELEAVCNFRTPGLVDAFAAVPREQFLGPGPWTVLGDAGDGIMMGGPPRMRTTPDADPARVYHNIAIAIDPSRQLFNGQPGTLAVWLDVVGLSAGARVLHVGCGLGYYTAVMAQAVGPAGRVVAFEVDETLAREARKNLASFPWVDVRHGDASESFDEQFDAVLVNAGVTHPLDTWLSALSSGGRMVLPLTGTMPGMAATIGKGLAWLLTKESDVELSARVIGIVAIYSAVGLRNEENGALLGKAMMRGPLQWSAVKRMRRDSHEADESCWLHASTWCLSSAERVESG